MPHSGRAGTVLPYSKMVTVPSPDTFSSVLMSVSVSAALTLWLLGLRWAVHCDTEKGWRGRMERNQWMKRPPLTGNVLFLLLLFSSNFLITLLFSCLNRLHFTNSITPEISSQVYFSSLCLQVENVRKKKAKNCVWSYNRTLKIILWGKKQSKKFTKTCCGPRDVPGINQSIKSTINE